MMMKNPLDLDHLSEIVEAQLQAAGDQTIDAVVGLLDQISEGDDEMFSELAAVLISGLQAKIASRSGE